MFSAVFLFLKSPLAKYLGVALVILGIVGYIYHAGQKNVQKDWDAERAMISKEMEVLKIKSDNVTRKIETQYVDRVKVIEVAGETITKYVDRYITVEADSKCVLPKNAILLHDSAAKNIVPPGGTDK
jgi:hypothetical protein